MTHINPTPRYEVTRDENGVLVSRTLLTDDSGGYSPEDYDGPEDAALAAPDDCTYCDGTGQVVVDTGVGVVIESCTCTAGIAIRAIS